MKAKNDQFILEIVLVADYLLVGLWYKKKMNLRALESYGRVMLDAYPVVLYPLS